MRDARQMPLLPGHEVGPARPVTLLPIDAVRMIGSKADALRKCIDLSGYDQTRIAQLLGVDPTHLSRMLKTSADAKRYFPQELEPQLMKICGNALPAQWPALQIGCGLVPLESELERENRSLREQLAAERAEREAIVKFLRQTRGAE